MSTLQQSFAKIAFLLVDQPCSRIISLRWRAIIVVSVFMNLFAVRRLEPERRAWLRWAITANDPEHEWLQVL